MKNIKLLFLAAIMLAIYAGCRDEDTNPIPEPESAVHGWGRLNASSPKNFVYADPSKEMTIDFQWNSIDGSNQVSKVEFFAFFDETYADKENNERVARHAGRFLDANGAGKAFKTLEGSSLPANRKDATFKVTQADLYNLFKDTEFDYGNGKIKVFSNPAKPDRTAATPFVKGDAFEISWKIYTADGRVFDFWSRSICAEEFTRSSCTVKWAVVCASEIAGEVTYEQTDMVKGKGGGAGDPAPGTINGSFKIVQDSASGKPILGVYRIPDFSFGHFAFVWQDDPAFNTKAGKYPRLVDACNSVSTQGSDQYDDTYTFKVLSVAGADLTIRWNNTWGDAGTVKMTRKDGKNWPPLK